MVLCFVPFSDMGDGTFLPSDKAILFMRYIRKQLNRMSEDEKLKYETVIFDSVATMAKAVAVPPFKTLYERKIRK